MNQLAIVIAGIVARTAAHRWARSKGYDAEVTLLIEWTAGATASAATAAIIKRN